MAWSRITVGEILTLLEEKWENVPFWTGDEAQSAFNEAMREWNLLTGYWKRRVVIPTVAGVPWIAVPSTLVYNTRIAWRNQPSLSLSSLEDLANFRLGWEGETTVSGGDVPATPKLWAPAGLTLFAIWPSDALGGNDLTVDGIRATPFIASPPALADFIDIGDHELDALLGFALHIAAFKAGEPFFSATKVFQRDFYLAAADQNSRLRASAYYRQLMGLDLQRAARPLKLLGTPSVASPQGASNNG